MHGNLETVVVVTGVAGGIGMATAAVLLEGGYTIVGGDTPEALDDLAARSGLGSLDRVHLIPYDATLQTDAVGLVEAAAALEKQLRGLVVCAGVYGEGRIEEMPFEEWRRVLSVNLDGVFSLLAASRQALASQASVVLVSSIAGHRGSSRHSHYAASKGGVNALVRSLAWEWAPDVRVNGISPGTIRTPMTDTWPREREQGYLNSTPLGRYGSAAEVANCIRFLVSDESSYVTGQTLHVNGGMYMS